MKNKNMEKTGKKWKLVAGAVLLVAIVEAAHHLPHGRKIEGVYSGVVPCANCEGIRETLSLKDGKYEMKVEYLGKNESSFVETGKYSVKKCGTVVLEDYTDGPNAYRLAGSDALLHLDMGGNPIESEFNYVLVKK